MMAFIGVIGLQRMDIEPSQMTYFILTYRFVLGIFTILLVTFLLSRFRFTWSYIVGILACTIISIIIRVILNREILYFQWKEFDLGSVVFHLSFKFDFRAFYIIPMLVLEQLIANITVTISLLQVHNYSLLQVQLIFF